MFKKHAFESGLLDVDALESAGSLGDLATMLITMGLATGV
jgi:hypothetical protein